jgi:hypothetical protein
MATTLTTATGFSKFERKRLRRKSSGKRIPRKIVSEEIGAAISAFRGRETSPNGRPLNGRVAIPIGMTRSRRKTLHGSSGARIRWRLEKIRDAWNDFQASRTRDAVYGYLEAVFAIISQFKVRRKSKKLLRHAFEFAQLPFDKNADPSTAGRVGSWRGPGFE